MKTQHTPGPWLVSTIQGSNVLMVGAGSDGSNIIADVRTPHKKAEGNARLIAAAPELLKMLENILSSGELEFVWLNDIAELVAKARGEA